MEANNKRDDSWDILMSDLAVDTELVRMRRKLLGKVVINNLGICLTVVAFQDRDTIELRSMTANLSMYVTWNMLKIMRIEP